MKNEEWEELRIENLSSVIYSREQSRIAAKRRKRHGAADAATKNELPQKIAKIAKKKCHKFLSLRSLHCNTSESLIIARIFLPRISRISRMKTSLSRINSPSVKSVKSVVQFPLVAAGRAAFLCGKKLLGIA